MIMIMFSTVKKCHDKKASGASLIKRSTFFPLVRHFKFISLKPKLHLFQSNWVFLAVTPTVGNVILPKLKFKKGQTIVSFISTIKMAELKKLKIAVS